LWKQLSWVCVLFLLVMNTAQVAHVCSLPDDVQPLGSATQFQAASSAPSHSFCVICASSHAPSLAAPFVSIASSGGVSTPALARRPLERSVAPLFALYIRPPPAR
jgi:hypothetical protein